ncbi:acyl-CoA thioesterase [Bradyrhizobium sp. TM239]|uniref:acyl-CoA thioesterase n=1 Tax=Bradyrhizobium sp. TM239 TaxID=2599802 RepID=UPI0027D6BBD0|nr:hypothetical protein TM239_01610 [Bradyrhizobium sp. TM239]
MTYNAVRTIKFGQCDPSSLVYFPTYLDILVGVVEEFFEEIGFAWPSLIRERKLGLPTVRLDVTFKQPGFHGDRLNFALRVRQIGTSSLDLNHHVTHQDKTLWLADQRIVATSLETHRATEWPSDLRSALVQRLDHQGAPPDALV